MKFESYLKSFKVYLQVERGLSENTVVSYVSDIESFLKYLDGIDTVTSLSDILSDNISGYLCVLHDLNFSKTSQARIISSLRSFFKYLMIEKCIEENHNPMEVIELPRLGHHLPDVLSVEEIERIMRSVDLSEPNGQRNRAILETLYGCGLRVSELVNIKISDIYFDEQFVRVFGKGNKERLVPIDNIAIRQITGYIACVRNKVIQKKEYKDILFLNNRGGKLTREMVFIIVKKYAQQAGITKSISPHTFRHSFATHLIQNGADIRIVQEMLGHESIMTTEIYTHINNDYLREVIDRYHPFSALDIHNNSGEDININDEK